MARPAVYPRIASALRERFALVADGREVPSVRSLAAEFKAAPTTILKALHLLAEEGVIRRASPSQQYVRHWRGGRHHFMRAFPAAAILRQQSTPLFGTDYMTALVGAFAGRLCARGIPACFFPAGALVSSVPGGLAVGDPPIKTSGIVFVSGAPAALLKELVNADTVVVTLDYVSGIDGVDSVAVECEGEGRKAVEYLAGLGHRHIAFLARRAFMRPKHWPEGADPDSLRIAEAMLATKRRLGLNASPRYHLRFQDDGSGSATPIAGAFEAMLHLAPPPTAVVCLDDEIARRLLSVLQRRGIECPRNMSIVGRGSERPEPDGITTLVSEPLRMGAVGAEHFVDRMVSPTSQAASLQFSSFLAEGRTTAPPRSSAV